jgi:type IV pilus assembly protein PilW
MSVQKVISIERSRQLGLSLVEVMVAITISLILLAGVIQILASSKTSYRVLEASSRIQENGRFAIGFINDSARMAGFLGCYSNTGSIESRINSPTSYNWDYATAIQGNEWSGASWSPALNALVSGNVLAGTDVLATRSVAYDGVNLAADSTPSQLIAVNANNITNGDIMVVSNCSRATVFQVTDNTIAGNQITISHGTGGGWTPGNNAANLTNAYSATDSQVARLVTNVYYIGTGASGSPALFRQSTVAGGTMQAQELVDNVENMQVLYGEDTNSDGIANRYVTANNVGNMANVVSVRVSLLLRTDDNISSSFQTYTYNGANVIATDHRMRRVFNTTIKIRNRGIL